MAIQLSSLLGARSMAANTFRLNDQYMTGVPISTRNGYTNLGMHAQLNLGFEPNYALPAWQRYIDSTIMPALAAVHVTGLGLQYTNLDVAAYITQCWMIHLMFAEWDKDLSMMDFVVPESANALRDYFGNNWQQVVNNRMNRTDYCMTRNGYADSFYTQFPFPLPAQIAYIADLLRAVWRDDPKGKRTNYIYFHMFNVDAEQGADPYTHYVNLCKKWLPTDLIGHNLTPPDYTNTNIFSMLGPNKLMYIRADMRAVFGTSVQQSVPLLTGLDPILFRYDSQLIASMNQSPYGLPAFAKGDSGAASANVPLDAITTATYKRTQNTDLAAAFAINQGYFYNVGPRYEVYKTYDWSAALSNPDTWQNLVTGCKDRYFDFPVYARNLQSFSGERVLTDFAFTSIDELVVYNNVDPLNPTVDPSCDMSIASGTLYSHVLGMYGFTIARVWSNSDLVVVNAVNTEHAQCRLFVVARQGPATFRYWPINFNTPMADLVKERETCRALANSIDAITTWQFAITAVGASLVYWVVTDEDIDEWSILPANQLLAVFSSTARGMFDSSTVVPARSNKIAGAQLAGSNATLNVQDRSQTSSRGNRAQAGGRGKGDYNGTR